MATDIYHDEDKDIAGLYCNTSMRPLDMSFFYSFENDVLNWDAQTHANLFLEWYLEKYGDPRWHASSALSLAVVEFDIYRDALTKDPESP